VDTRLIRDNALRTRKVVFYPNPERTGSPELIQTEGGDVSAEDRAIGAAPVGSSLSGAGPFLIIVPGLLFDDRGNRLGRGRGWYDRLLSDAKVNGISLALAYEFQIGDEVPVEEWDRPVDYIVTERRTIDCARKRSSLAS
jgi:5,10-methenyltetrahydrofolate synthetase